MYIDKGRKAGATEAALYILNRIAGLQPLRATYIIGPTQKEQSEICWQNRRAHQMSPLEWEPEFYNSDHRVRFPNESFIKVAGANDPDSSRGREGDAFIWDEAKDHNPDALDSCYPNVLSRNALWIVMGTPARTKDNHFYKLKQTVADDPEWFKIHMTAWDNTFLPGGHEWLKKEREKYYARGDWDLWEIEWEGRWIFNSRRKVLPSFDSTKHVRPFSVLKSEVDKDARHLRWVTIIDPGYRTCFCVLFCCYNPYTAQFYCLDEIYSTEKDMNSARIMWPKIVEKQKKLFGGKWSTVYDSAALAFAVEVNSIQKASGERIQLVPTSKSPDDEEEYFRLINSSMHEQGLFYISEDCVETIGEIENYETDEWDRYPDEKNHALDDLRYGYKFLNYTLTLKRGRATIIPNNERQHDSFDPNNIEDNPRKEGWQGFEDYTVQEKLKGWLQ